MAKSFRPKKHEDFEILDDNDHVIGQVRIKPSGVLWSPKNKHDWYRVPIEEFADFMEENGKEQAK